jgi:hypothetical protein
MNGWTGHKLVLMVKESMSIRDSVGLKNLLSYQLQIEMLRGELNTLSWERNVLISADRFPQFHLKKVLDCHELRRRHSVKLVWLKSLFLCAYHFDLLLWHRFSIFTN